MIEQYFQFATGAILLNAKQYNDINDDIKKSAFLGEACGTIFPFDS